MVDDGNKDYDIGPTWVFFSLPEAKKYYIKDYAVLGHALNQAAGKNVWGDQVKTAWKTILIWSCRAYLGALFDKLEAPLQWKEITSAGLIFRLSQRNTCLDL